LSDNSNFRGEKADKTLETIGKSDNTTNLLLHY